MKFFWGAAFLVLAALVFAYGNHFQNGFHFDDFHTIVDNPAVHDLNNLARFFTHASTFSITPQHQSYRPLVTASVALDYRLGKGPNPFYFHLSTFGWYLLLLAAVFTLFLQLMDATDPAPENRWYALFGTALYGLHPVSAETVNYIIQRAEIYCTAGVVLGLVLYIRLPRVRRTGLYLAPAALAMLAKTPAAVFAGLLFVYILLFEENWNLRRALMKSAPSILVCAAVGGFVLRMERGFSPGGSHPWLYRLTQPAIAWHYFRSFFWPLDLSADSDFQLVSGLRDPRMIAGAVFLATLIAATIWAARNRDARPIGFGLAWFLLALLPTAAAGLAEVENDHRMFFPFAGLTLAAVWGVRLLAGDRVKALIVPATLLLAVCVYGTRARNSVWATEDSLWQDVVEKSPHNGRGLMNYGVTLMKSGDISGALGYFQRAIEYAPDYSLVHVNIGIAQATLNQNALAESHFRRAIELEPTGAEGYLAYGRWLVRQHRLGEAAPMLERGVALNPADMEGRKRLLLVYANQSQWAKLDRLADDSLRVFPGDSTFLRYRNERFQPERAPSNPTSLLRATDSLYRAGQYRESIQRAEEALELDPGSAEAYSQLAANYAALGDVDDSLRTAREALRLKPDLAAARRTLERVKDLGVK